MVVSRRRRAGYLGVGCNLRIEKIPRWESKCEGSQISVYEMVVVVVEYYCILKELIVTRAGPRHCSFVSTACLLLLKVDATLRRNVQLPNRVFLLLWPPADLVTP